MLLQQCLPFTVLKLVRHDENTRPHEVATVLTVYGIETIADSKLPNFLCLVATVLTVYGIETFLHI